MLTVRLLEFVFLLTQRKASASLKTDAEHLWLIAEDVDTALSRCSQNCSEKLVRLCLFSCGLNISLSVKIKKCCCVSVDIHEQLLVAVMGINIWADVLNTGCSMSINHGVIKLFQVQPLFWKLLQATSWLFGIRLDWRISIRMPIWWDRLSILKTVLATQRLHQFFQIADIGSGFICWVNAGCFQRVRMLLNRLKSKVVFSAEKIPLILLFQVFNEWKLSMCFVLVASKSQI